LKSKASAQNYRKRMKELEKASTRIETKIAKLERMITSLSRSLGQT
jgi:exonuclease VII small subunit